MSKSSDNHVSDDCVSDNHVEELTNLDRKPADPCAHCAGHVGNSGEVLRQVNIALRERLSDKRGNISTNVENDDHAERTNNKHLEHVTAYKRGNQCEDEHEGS